MDNRLRDRPVIVAPGAAGRAAVYDMSEEAYRSGVRKGMLLRRALGRCPDAAVVPPHHHRYAQAMDRLLHHAVPFSPCIEMCDHQGHLFVDVTGSGRLFGPPQDVAQRIRREVKRDMGIDPIWSVAANKLLAKVATRIVKPVGEYVVRTGDEASLLGPLPLFLVPGVEMDDVRRLAAYHLRLTGQVAALLPEQLDVMFGPRGRDLHAAVRGIDASPVRPVGEAPPVVRRAHDFGTDTNDVAVVAAAVFRMAEAAGAELRRRGQAAGSLRVAIQYTDGGTRQSRARLRPASALDRRLYTAALEALHRAWLRRTRIRHLALTCEALTFPPAQQALFAEDRAQQQREERLTAALDAVRARFGKSAILVGPGKRGA
jgi:DNA polymerase-4